MADDSLTEAEITVLLGGRKHSTQLPASAPEQLLELVTRIHDAAARHFGAELSAMVRRTARVRLSRIQALSESDFCARAELPSFLRRFTVDPFSRGWIVEVRPNALFPIIDCLLGGGREKTPIARRPLTEIEARLAARVVRAWIHSLQTAWQAAAPLVFAQEFEPVKAGHTSGDEVLALAFDVELAGSQGSLHLAIPLVEIGAICASVDEQPALAGACEGSQFVARLRDVPLDSDEVASLAIGDVITTDHRADEPVIVAQDGVPRFVAKLGAWLGHKAIEIERAIPNEGVGADDSATA